HDGLHKYAVIRAGDPNILAKKVLAQVMQWNAAWEKLSALEKTTRRIASRKEIALERTAEAQRLLETLRNTLTGEIELDPALDWEQYKVRTPFSVAAP